MKNFSWVIPGQLAGCAGPSGDEDLAFLREKGIKLIVRLAEEEKAKVTTLQVNKAGLDDLHEPIPDFCAPSQEQIDKIIEKVKSYRDRREPVAVSCGFGIGRTGTILSCILISWCYNVKDALQKVQKERRQEKAWEKENQLNAILTYAERIGKQ